VFPLFGPHKWKLPVHEIEFNESIKFSNGVESYRYFTKFFLEGDVFPVMKQFKPFLLARPDILCKDWTQVRVAAMIQPLLKNKIDTKKKLLQKWYFLLFFNRDMRQIFSDFLFKK